MRSVCWIARLALGRAGSSAPGLLFLLLGLVSLLLVGLLGPRLLYLGMRLARLGLRVGSVGIGPVFLLRLLLLFLPPEWTGRQCTGESGLDMQIETL